MVIATRSSLLTLTLLWLLRGSYAQSIPPSAFVIAGVLPPPPPPPSDLSVGFDGQTFPSPPPPSSPTVAPPPATNTSSTSGSALPAGSKSSGLSGGAIAGIVIGAIAGAISLALLAFFLLRGRRRRGLPVTVPSKEDRATVEWPKDPEEANLAKLPTSEYGLSWEPGESKNLPSAFSAGVFGNGPPEVSTAGSGKDLGTFQQLLLDNTAVIVHKGPGGSARISKAPPSSDTHISSESSQVTSMGTDKTVGSPQSVAASGSLGLPELPWSDWEIKADDIHFAKDVNGQPVKLGSGAYGTVFKATIDGVAEVAVKIFHEVHSQLQQADILREVAILKSCRDRNIVQFLGAGIMEERILLVTELMEAGDLWHALARDQGGDTRELGWYNRGKRMAIEVARGLHFLHRHKIIHFDLKSANVLLTRDGTAKISDVGFANILSNTHLTNNNNAQGFTFAWAAPEVLIGVVCTDKVDIFSYGVLLWEIVTGQQPRRGQLRQCRVPEECPKEVDDLLQQCLNFDPEARPSCKQIVEVLAGHQDADTPRNSNTGAP